MTEPQAPFWIWGSGRLELGLDAPASTLALLRVDGKRAKSFVVAGPTTIEVELSGQGWHSLLLEIPRLFATEPARGLRLTRLTVIRIREG